MTVKQAAQTAIDVQDASNISGVIHSWAEVCKALIQAGVYVNDHPINKMFADKVMQLAKLSGDNDYADAYMEVMELAQEVDEPGPRDEDEPMEENYDLAVSRISGDYMDY